MSGGRADYIVSAIRDDNPDTSLEVVDYGRIVRVQAPRYLRVTRATLQWHLGPNFDLTALESMIVSSVGHITRTSEQLIWHEERQVRRHRSFLTIDDISGLTGRNLPTPDARGHSC
jgi:toluene monooxygenase system protein D